MSDEKKKEDYEMYIPIKEALEKVLENLRIYKDEYGNKEQYLETGFKEFFLRKGDLILMASPKYWMNSFVSSLISNIAFELKKPVGYISCGEKDSVYICTKLLSNITRISMHKLLEGYLKQSEVEELLDKAEKIFDSPIFIDDSPNCYFEEFEFTARLMVENQKVELIIVDSFKYLKENVTAEKIVLPYDQADLLEKYKEVSRRLNVPIIILMDLPAKEDDEPSISDFKSNMIIPRTVDQVLFLHQKLIPESPVECNATLIIAKNAHGINMQIPLIYNPSNGIYKSF